MHEHSREWLLMGPEGVHGVLPCGHCGAVVLAERSADHQALHDAVTNLANGVAALVEELSTSVAGQHELARAVEQLAATLAGG